MIKLSNFIFIALLMVLFSACSSYRTESISSDLPQDMASFEASLENVVSVIRDKKSTFSDIEIKNDVLIAQAKELLPALSKKYPKCRNVLSYVLANTERMKNLSHTDIEEKFHDGEELPKNSNDSCYELKELIVHPATVHVLLKEKQDSLETRQSMENELVELKGHLAPITQGQLVF